MASSYTYQFVSTVQVHLYLQLFAGGFVSCPIYIICTYLHSIVVCFLLCLSSSCVLCNQCCQFLWIVHLLYCSFDVLWHLFTLLKSLKVMIPRYYTTGRVLKSNKKIVKRDQISTLKQKNISAHFPGLLQVLQKGVAG